MSARGRALRALMARFGRGWQSLAIPTEPGDVVFIGADHALLGNWSEWLPDVPVRALGERVLLTDELEQLLAVVHEPRALVILTGTSDLLGVGGSGSPSKAVSKLAALLTTAKRMTQGAHAVVVGVPPRHGWENIAEYNTLAAKLSREHGATFLEAPALPDQPEFGYLLSASAWDAETYRGVAMLIAEVLGLSPVGTELAQRLMRLEGSITDKSRQLRQELFRMLPPANGRVVLLGDSITEGGAWDGWLRSVRPINRGISGNRISQVLERLDTAIDSPAAVSLLIGTNDLATGNESRDVDAIADRFRHLIHKITERAPNSPIIINSVLPRRKKYADRIRALNERFQMMSDETGAAYLDLWPLLATTDGAIRPELTTDGLHLNAAGYRVWTGALKPILDSSLQQKKRNPLD
jgi:lysophospholipase L1-like esterase